MRASYRCCLGRKDTEKSLINSARESSPGWVQFHIQEPKKKKTKKPKNQKKKNPASLNSSCCSVFPFLQWSLCSQQTCVCLWDAIFPKRRKKEKEVEQRKRTYCEKGDSLLMVPLRDTHLGFPPAGGQQLVNLPTYVSQRFQQLLYHMKPGHMDTPSVHEFFTGK